MTAVGLSGGVDSAAAALKLIEDGEKVIGVTMTLGRTKEDEEVAKARAVAARLGVDFKCVDLSKLWQCEVREYLTREYLTGRTPNPCVRCNEFVKFCALPRFVFETLGCEYFATGHYARLKLAVGGVSLRRGRDNFKDQSYFLYRVSSTVLSRTIFPLGGLTKAEVREYAQARGFEEAAKQAESQDFCGGSAVPQRPDIPGDIVDCQGRVIGRHRGFWHYTVGKRKGLGIGGGTPFYVIGLKAAQNQVVVAPRAQAVTENFEITDVCGWALPSAVHEELQVKVRSAGEPQSGAKVRLTGSSGTVNVRGGIFGVAPGQSAVFYRGDEVVGGGIISARA